MADEAKPMMERFLDYYKHVMVDLRDPRFVSCVSCIGGVAPRATLTSEISNAGM